MRRLAPTRIGQARHRNRDTGGQTVERETLANNTGRERQYLVGAANPKTAVWAYAGAVPGPLKILGLALALIASLLLVLEPERPAPAAGQEGGA